jgi:hypothetical protein
MIGRGCFKRAIISAWSILTLYTLFLHPWSTSIRQFVNEYLPGLGAMASHELAASVSVTLVPYAKSAAAAPAQQSSKMNTSARACESIDCIADHLTVHPVSISDTKCNFGLFSPDKTYSSQGESWARVLYLSLATHAKTHGRTSANILTGTRHSA